jgi:hypothetical protein
MDAAHHMKDYFTAFHAVSTVSIMSFWLRHRIIGKMCFVYLQDGRISYKQTLK